MPYDGLARYRLAHKAGAEGVLTESEIKAKLAGLGRDVLDGKGVSSACERMVE